MSEPEGLFRDPSPPKASERPVYRMLVRGEPGIDETRALRALLKVMLRRFGLRCTSLAIEKQS